MSKSVKCFYTFCCCSIYISHTVSVDPSPGVPMNSSNFIQEMNKFIKRKSYDIIFFSFKLLLMANLSIL